MINKIIFKHVGRISVPYERLTKEPKLFLFHVFTRIRGNLCGMLYSTSPYKQMQLKMNSVLNINVGIKRLSRAERATSAALRDELKQIGWNPLTFILTVSADVKMQHTSFRRKKPAGISVKSSHRSHRIQYGVSLWSLTSYPLY